MMRFEANLRLMSPPEQEVATNEFPKQIFGVLELKCWPQSAVLMHGVRTNWWDHLEMWLPEHLHGAIPCRRSLPNAHVCMISANFINFWKYDSVDFSCLYFRSARHYTTAICSKVHEICYYWDHITAKLANSLIGWLCWAKDHVESIAIRSW